MSTSVYTGLNPFNFIRKHFLQISLCLSVQQLAECTVFICVVQTVAKGSKKSEKLCCLGQSTCTFSTVSW